MPKTVMCKKLGKELDGFEKPPWPGEIGERIVAEISKEAWGMWLETAKMIINEYKLNLGTPEAQQIISEQMEAFLFGDSSETLPTDFVPPSEDS
jgi:Fe-S cluster biosynthesis and repair protein YggX